MASHSDIIVSFIIIGFINIYKTVHEITLTDVTSDILIPTVLPHCNRSACDHSVYSWKKTPPDTSHMWKDRPLWSWFVQFHFSFESLSTPTGPWEDCWIVWREFFVCGCWICQTFWKFCHTFPQMNEGGLCLSFMCLVMLPCSILFLHSGTERSFPWCRQFYL